MFFPLQILKDRGSNLAIVWRAATLKLKSRDKAELLNVELEEICREITKQAALPSLGNVGPLNGFSLRLSAQLLHGVTIIMSIQFKELTAFARNVEKSLEFTKIYEKLLTKEVDLQSLSTMLSGDQNGSASDSSFERRKKKKLNHLQLLEEPYILPLPEMNEVVRSVNVEDITLPPELPSQTQPHDMFLQEMDHQALLPEDNQFDLASLMKDADQEVQQDNMFLNENLQTPEAAIRPEPTSPPPKNTQQEEESVLAVPLLEEPEEEPTVLPHQLDATYNEIPPDHQVVSEESAQLQLDELQQIRKTKKLKIDPQIELKSEIIRSRLALPKKNFPQYIDEGHLVDPSTRQTIDDVFNRPSIDRKRKFLSVVAQMVAEEVDFLQTNPNWEKEIDMADVGAEVHLDGMEFGDADVSEHARLGDSTTLSQARAGLSAVGSGLSLLSELNKTEKLKMGSSEDVFPEVSAIEADAIPEPDFMDAEQPEVPIPYVERTFTKAEFLSKVEECSTEHGYALFGDITHQMNKKDKARVFMQMLKEASLRTIVTRQESPFEAIKIEIVVA